METPRNHGMVTVRFVRSHKPFHVGERVTVSRKVAENLIALGVALEVGPRGETLPDDREWRPHFYTR